MTVLLVTTRLEVDVARDEAEWWPEVLVDGELRPHADALAAHAWDLVELLTAGLPTAKVYRIEVEPWADDSIR